MMVAMGEHRYVRVSHYQMALAKIQCSFPIRLEPDHKDDHMEVGDRLLRMDFA